MHYFSINIAVHQYIKIESIFPIRGHSYVPPDGSFGRVQKFINKNYTILTPQQYYIHFEKVGKIRKIVEDWDLIDWKSLSNDILKKKQTLKI